MLYYENFLFICQKISNCSKNRLLKPNSALHSKQGKKVHLFEQTQFSEKQIEIFHKITCYFHDMRKILRPKILSQGTHLGYLGS